MKPPKAADTAKAKQISKPKTERRPGLSRSDLTAGRWGQDDHQLNRPGGSGMSGQPTGKRSYSGYGGNQSSKKRV